MTTPTPGDFVRRKLQRCAVCGFRRYWHDKFKEPFYTVSHIGKPPKRGWWL